MRNFIILFCLSVVWGTTTLSAQTSRSILQSFDKKTKTTSIQGAEKDLATVLATYLKGYTVKSVSMDPKSGEITAVVVSSQGKTLTLNEGQIWEMMPRDVRETVAGEDAPSDGGGTSPAALVLLICPDGQLNIKCLGYLGDGPYEDHQWDNLGPTQKAAQTAWIIAYMNGGG